MWGALISGLAGLGMRVASLIGLTTLVRAIGAGSPHLLRIFAALIRVGGITAVYSWLIRWMEFDSVVEKLIRLVLPLPLVAIAMVMLYHWEGADNPVVADNDAERVVTLFLLGGLLYLACLGLMALGRRLWMQRDE